MNKIVGIDVGRGATKVVTTNGNEDLNFTFPTLTVVEQEDSYGYDDYVTVNDVRYRIGMGNGITIDNKADDTTFNVCLLYALARIGGSKFDVVTGLPISHCKKYRQDIIDKLKGTSHKVLLERNGEEPVIREFTIDNIEVVPEGILCLCDEKNDNLVIDIGYFTVDVAFFKRGVLKKAESYPNGVGELYESIASSIRKKGALCTDRDAEGYVDIGSYIFEGQEVELDLNEYVKQQYMIIKKAIQTGFNWTTTTKTFIGGGVHLFDEYVIRDYGKVVAGTELANAKRFYEFGVSKW